MKKSKKNHKNEKINLKKIHKNEKINLKKSETQKISEKSTKKIKNLKIGPHKMNYWFCVQGFRKKRGE